MHRKTNFFTIYTAFAAIFILGFLCSGVSAQKSKISIKCVEDEKQTTAKQEEKTKASPVQTNTKETPPKLELSKSADVNEQSLTPDSILPINCTAAAFITAGPSPYANQTVIFTLTQSPVNILALKTTPVFAPPYQYTLQIAIQLDDNGFGVSDDFYIKATSLGETTLSHHADGFDSVNDLDILVVECKCPVIPVNSPPRN